MKTDARTLVVATDSVHARLFEERRQGGPLLEHPDWAGDLAPTPKAGAPRGSVHDRMGFALHGVDGGDPRQRAAEDFLRRLADRIGAVMRDERFDALVIFAPPRPLGILREHLAPQVLAKLVHDADEDRVDETVDALREHLRDVRFPID